MQATEFSADYRVGNGGAGNVGAEALYHFVAAQAVSAAIESIRNPLPAAGGLEPETSEEVRQAAPVAFKTQQRAVTPADYCERCGPISGRAASRGLAALDGQLAHGLHYGRSVGRRGR